MTIGNQLLHEAKVKLKAALTALRDELKNPDTSGEARDSMVSFNDEMDQHCREIGIDEAMRAATKPQDTEASAVDQPDGDKGEDVPNAIEPEAPANAEHESLGEKIKEDASEALHAAGEVIGEAKFNT